MAPRKVKLHAPFGTDEANVGTESFPVDDAGNIEVPPEAADDLVKVGGFTVVEDAPPPVPEGMVRVEHSDPDVVCPEILRDVHGMLAPAARIPDLLSHGFRVVEDAPEMTEASAAPVQSPAAPATPPVDTPAPPAAPDPATVQAEAQIAKVI